MSDLPDARQRDPFAPPAEPCECYCLHCQRVFMSDGIWFQKVIGDPSLDGFWMCPTPNCDGAGFTFDIFPTDPDHPANAGWVYCDDEEYDEDDGEAEAEWDPDEPKYKQLDEELGDEDDDIEGEEWKYGLSPGEEPEESESMKKARLEWEQEQQKYDSPDERPRILDWSDRAREREESRRASSGDSANEGDEEPQFSEDDIPF